jgi:predicted dithiol-disulfide oxidoreductase (DUF899 family)
MSDHTIGTRQDWGAAREELLELEKEHTRLGDELARRRRELPWVRVEKEYRLETDDGARTLVELFDCRSQLCVYHFMFGQLRGWLHDVLVDCGRRQRCRPAPERARRDHALRLARPAREAAGLQAADGLELPLGVIGQQ